MQTVFMPNRIHKFDAFWDAYRHLVISTGVNDSIVGWYVQWAKQFAVLLKGWPLGERAVEDVHVLNTPGLAVKSPADF